MSRRLAILGWWTLGSAVAMAFILSVSSSGKVLRWETANPPSAAHTNIINRQTHAIRYFLAADAWSAGNAAAELDSIRAAFDQWQAIPGVGVRFEDAGLVGAGVDVNTSDHTNVVFWAKGTTVVNGGHDDLGGALGLTFVRFNSDRQLLEADIVLNGVRYQWFTSLDDTANSGRFVEATALHEIGHFLGLLHSPVGGATMLATGGPGVQDSQIGLSSDDIAGARTLYPVMPFAATRSRLRGKVTKGGAAVLGATVIVEDSHGSVVAGTLTSSTGGYDLPNLPPGNYGVRATPLDPCNGTVLVCGLQVSTDYATADIHFLPTTNSPVTLTAGATSTLDLAVTAGDPPFRVTSIRRPAANPDFIFLQNSAALLRPGQSNVLIGVFSPDLPTNNATLTLTGDGVTVGATRFSPGAFPGLNLISVPVAVASDATPGLRSFRLTKDNASVYANGFVEILPAIADNNFDGLDDAFQRRYFRRFTAPEAAPGADPDGDRFTNSQEYVAGTSPSNSASLLKVLSVRSDAGGSTVQWQSVPGRRYQLFGREDVAGAPWIAVGGIVVAAGATAEQHDPLTTGTERFYRVQVLPP